MGIRKTYHKSLRKNQQFEKIIKRNQQYKSRRREIIKQNKT